MQKTQAAFYLEQYPRLLRQVGSLVELARSEDPNVALLALFGSVACLKPRDGSDADLLILLHDLSLLYQPAKTARVVQLLGEAERAPQGERCVWPFSGVVSDAQASDIEPEFLTTIACDGVLLSLQPGVTLPPVLAKLLPYTGWLEQVQALLEECKRVAGGQATKTLA
jgi:predicted nucleotidyltransferase